MAVKAICVLKPGHTGDAALVKTLQDHVKATIAPFKYPRVIEFVATLPRTETGKLQRFKLRQAAAAATTKSAAAATTTATTTTTTTDPQPKESA